MTRFQYARPDTLAQLVSLLHEHGASARVLAGGTDVVVRLRLGHWRPTHLIDMKRVADLGSEILEIDGGLRIGARVVMTDVIADARVCRKYPALVESARVVGSVQIRNRATLVGNICNASPAADTAPALLVYGAVVNATSVAGPRRIPLSEFFAGPGRTTLRQAEVVESIDLPRPRVAEGSAFGRVTRRWGVDLATVNVSCLVSDTGVTRLAFGAAGPTPVLVQDDSGVLLEGGVSAAAHAILGRLISRAAPISDVRGGRDYRTAMLDVLGRRALATSLDRLREARAGS